MLIKHKQKCGDDKITTIKTSNKSHLHWEKHFHKNPLCFRIYADFEADNEKTIHVLVIKQLIFINRNQYLLVIT